MDVSNLLQVGMAKEKVFRVEEENTAVHVGSGSSRVLATPWMIAFMERAARDLLAEQLPAGASSVGVLVNVRHLAPTPVGCTVRTRAEVQAVDGSKVTFLVQAWDEREQVGAGEHQRVVIDESRFLKRVAAKSQVAPQD